MNIETRGLSLEELEKINAELERRDAIIRKGLAVVEDFMPNIANCALQDYGRLNEFLMEAKEFAE